MERKPASITLKKFKQYMKEYINDPSVAQNTRNIRRHTLEKVVSYMEEEGIASIDAKAMLGFRGSLREYSPNTISQYMKQTSTFCNWMIGMGVIKESVVPRKLRAKERYDEAKSVLRKEDIQRLVGAQRPDGMWRSAWLRNKAMCFLAMSSGMRLSEMVSLRPLDIDAENLILTVQSGKGRKGRVVSITNMALDAMKEYADNVRPKDATKEDPFFCRVVNGEIKPVSKRTVEYCIKEHVSVTTGREDITPHCLRHSYASILAAENVPVVDIQSVLGHSSIQQTERYIQRLGTPSEAAKHATAAIEAAITPKGWATKKDPPLYT